MSGKFILFLYLLLFLVSSTLVVRKSGRVKQNLNFIAMYQLKLSHCIISKNGLFGLALERGV
jgi:hypothetical protein